MIYQVVVMNDNDNDMNDIDTELSWSRIVAFTKRDTPGCPCGALRTGHWFQGLQRPAAVSPLAGPFGLGSLEPIRVKTARSGGQAKLKH